MKQEPCSLGLCMVCGPGLAHSRTLQPRTGHQLSLLMYHPFLPQPLQDFEFLEFFAGHSALTREARRSGRISARFDIKYSDKSRARGRSNYMDLLDPSGFMLLACIKWLAWHCDSFKFFSPILRLAIMFILKGKPGFMAWFAIKCSTFVAVNAGTSGRTACSPVGFLEHLSVQLSNCLLERTAIYFLVVFNKLVWQFDSVRFWIVLCWPYTCCQNNTPDHACASLRWGMGFGTARIVNPWVLSCLVDIDDFTL